MTLSQTADKIKILNLYACLGGNRAKWDEVAQEAGIEIEVTAVELDPELARMYQGRFPNDTVIVSDAHQCLLDHYKEFDFIWSSPPCPSHSRARFWGSKTGKTKPVFPDLKLYEEILFLQNYFTGKFVVENVIPFYTPIIPGQKHGRHIYWTNFVLPTILSTRIDPTSKREKNELEQLYAFHQINLDSYKGEQRKNKIARNLVDYEAGKTILQTALGIMQQPKVEQPKLFL